MGGVWERGRILDGRYQLIEPLAKGGMGMVWRAEHISLRTPVAIKRLEPRRTGRADRLRFRREARTTARIRHPRVVEVMDYCDGPEPYLVLEYLHGQTVGDRMDRPQPMSRWAIVDLIDQCAEGLEVIHRAGVIHRDLKPENLFFCETGGGEQLKILDFGVAHDGRLSLVPPSPNSVVGTSVYLPPEVLAGEPQTHPLGDLWSLAVIAFECVTGVVPFAGATPSDVYDSYVLQRAEPRLDEGRHLSPSLVTFFERAFARDVLLRPASPRLFAGAFRKAVAGATHWDWTRRRHSTAPPTKPHWPRSTCS